MTQTLALFLDAYRELNARKLFWITLVISGVVVLAFAFIGINEQGLRIIVWDVSIPGLNSTVLPPSMFYKMMFLNLGIGFWLAWIATALALVSTAGIFPDFISAGSIDMVLAKPLGRLRLFLTKYCTGLLFVALQVTVFSVASFLVLGFKGGTWEPAVFLAIPIVTIFFSYLFCICTLLGLLTRSTIASLMLTLLAWFFMFAVGAAENSILAIKIMNQHEVDSIQRRVQRDQATRDWITEGSSETDPTVTAATTQAQERLNTTQAELDRSLNTRRKLDVAHDIAYGVKTVLPKTSETISLLERWMIDMAELQDVVEQADESERHGDRDMEQLQMDTAAALRSRSVWWVVGTSLMFEAVMLAIAAWIFCRRDF